MRIGRPAIVAAAIVAASCSTQTQLLVFVDSDLAIPGALDRLRVEVQVGERGMAADAALSSRADLPQTLGVTGSGGDEVRVVAIGSRGDTEVVRQVLSTSFVAGETRVVALSLASSCVGVSCGDGETCLLGVCRRATVDGTALPVWDGNDPSRYLDDRDAGEPPAPVDGGAGDAGPPPGEPFVAIGAGDAHSCGLRRDGAVFCWGANDRGQLGDRTTTMRPSPVAVADLASATALALGDAFSCALTDTGGVHCWGDDQRLQLGVTGVESRPAALPVDGVSDATGLAAGAAHACAVTAAEVLCWGAGTRGQLGNGTTDRAMPRPVTGLGSVSALALGAEHSCAVSMDVARCWGAGTEGQLGDGAMADRTAPADVRALADVVGVAAGAAHSCAIAGGAVRCWGANPDGRLGDGSTRAATTPVAATPP